MNRAGERGQAGQQFHVASGTHMLLLLCSSLGWSLASILQFCWLSLAALGVGFGTLSTDVFEVGGFIPFKVTKCMLRTELGGLVCRLEGQWSLAAQNDNKQGRG